MKIFNMENNVITLKYIQEYLKYEIGSKVEIGYNSKLLDLELDSLEFLEFIHNLEIVFNIEINSKNISNTTIYEFIIENNERILSINRKSNSLKKN